MNVHIPLLCTTLVLAACTPEPRTSQLPLAQMDERDYHVRAFIMAERIPLREIDLALPSYFQSNSLIAGARYIRFTADDARLYRPDQWYDYRPLTVERRQIVLPYEHIGPDDESAFVLADIVGPGLADEWPICLPNIPHMQPLAISPVLGRPLVGIWSDTQGEMSIVTFPNEYRCDGPTVDRRYHIIPAGRTPWREIRLTPNLHLPPAVVMVSGAQVGEPIIYARVQFTAAAVTFDD